ncbi:hypothetical protein OFC51_28160, partial [Escherichia coli]|nr:hypothetical protein [Escherichia coli]
MYYRAVKTLFFLLFLIGTSFSAGRIFGQVPTPTPDDGAIKTFEVRLPITVTEKKKNLVSGLRRSDFEVYEDGVKQEITFF